MILFIEFFVLKFNGCCMFTVYNDNISKSVRATLSNFTHHYLSKITVVKRIKSINPGIIAV